jgi:protein-disulfide isomerase
MKRNRLALLAAAAGIAVIAVVVVVAVGTRSSSSSAATSASDGGAAVFAGVPQQGDTLGDPAAPATLVVFEDPQCPFCREWALQTLPSVVADYVRPGKLKLSYRGVQIIGPNSQPGLRAIYAAGRQGKLWNVADQLYRRQGAENSGWITDAVVRAAARAAGADPGAVVAASRSAAVTRDLRASEAEARAGGLQGTPTFVIERPAAPAQQLQVGGLDAATFEAALAQALQ